MDSQRNHFSIGNIIGEAMGLYGDNFLVLWLPYLLISYPVSLINESVSASSGSIPAVILSTLAVYAAGGAVGLFVTLAALDRYAGRSGTPGDYVKRLKSLFIPYCLLQILMFLGILGGFLLLVVPGIILSLRWTIGSAVFVNENPGIVASLKRSRELTKGYKGEIFLIFLVVVLAYVAMLLIFAFLSRFPSGGFSGYWDTLSSLSSNHMSPMGMVYGILSTLINPLYVLLPAVMFFNLKKEREGYAAEELADSFLDGNDEVPGR